MTIAPLTVALVLGATLPEGSARYRFELAGEHVGYLELSVRCAATACTVRYGGELREPEEGGGKLRREWTEVEVGRDGRWAGGPIHLVRQGGTSRPRGVLGAVPASAAELVLLGELPPSGERCVETFDEEASYSAKACARRDGDAVEIVNDGVVERVVPAPDAFPERIEIAFGDVRFVREAAAAVPARAPRLHGTRVPGPADPALAAGFCGVARDPAPGAVSLAALPPPRADGESCREKTAAWLARARLRGARGRTAAGVAWDGSHFVWHAWAEVRIGDRWIPVDPSFEQAPADGPRFTVARFDDRDARARKDAGDRILACWGKARVEVK